MRSSDIPHAGLSDFTLYREDIKSEYREYANRERVVRENFLVCGLLGIAHDDHVISERIDQECEKFLCFLNTLEHEVSQYDSVLISVGPCRGQRAQHLPQYMINRAKSEKVLICLIDPEFLDKKNKFDDSFKNDLIALSSTIEGAEVESSQRWRYRSVRQECDLNLEVFPCRMPHSVEENLGRYFAKLLEQGLIRALDCDTNIYIANHTQAYSLADVPLLAEVYNKIKSTHGSSQLLQLYTHGGGGCRVTYYDELRYDEFSRCEFRTGYPAPSRLRVSDSSRHFYLSELDELENLSAFQMRSPLHRLPHRLAACLRAKTQGTNSTHVGEMLSVLESDTLSHQDKIEKMVCIACHANRRAVRLFANSHVIGKGRHKNIQVFYDKVEQLKCVEDLLQLKAWLKSSLSAFIHQADKAVETSQAATRSQFFTRPNAAVSRAVTEAIPPRPLV